MTLLVESGKRIRGHYLGTEIGGRWWHRYMKKRMLARGNGELWYDEDGIHFIRYLTSVPLSIPFTSITGFKIGRWHAGRWGGGRPILKVLWRNDGLRLSSGFLTTSDVKDANRLIAAFRGEMGRSARPMS